MTWFKNLRTRTKLLTAFGLLCVMIAGLGWFAISRLNLVNHSTTEIATEWLPKVKFAGELNTETSDMRRVALRYLMTDTADTRQQVDAQMTQLAERIKQTDESYAALLKVPEGRRLLAKFRDQWTAYLGLQKKLLDLSRVNQREALASPLIEESKTSFEMVEATLLELIQFNERSADEAKQAATETYQGAVEVLVGTIAVLLLLSVVLALVIASWIAKPMARASEVLRDVAGGDFTIRLRMTGQDEVGQMSQALDSALDKIQTALTEVREVAEGLAASALQLSSTSEEISSGAQEQAASLEETSASLEEMTTTVKQSADNARQASQLAGGSRASAEKGGEVVGQAVAAMAEINTASKQIADIITTIDEIAFQTNLLALNAAVEAARAGEQGRGFAVVAAEVRNLAQGSATAAKEIKARIQDSVRKVEGGSALVDRSGQTLSEIIASVKRVTDLVDEMAAASREQATGIDQVSRAINQMDQVTQANAAQTEQMSATAQALSSRADQLRELVARFRLDDGTRTTRIAPRPTGPRPPAVKPIRRVARPRALRAGGTDAGIAPPGNGHVAHEAQGQGQDAMDEFVASASKQGFEQA